MANGSEDLIMASAEAGDESISATQRSDPRQMAPDEGPENVDKQRSRECETCGKEFPERCRSVYVTDGYCTCFVPEDKEEPEIPNSAIRFGHWDGLQDTKHTETRKGGKES